MAGKALVETGIMRSKFGIRRLLRRREFIAKTLSAASVASLAPGLCSAAEQAAPQPIPVVVFSKVYQELKLGFDEAADLTAEVGLDGVDCPVRPGGEVLPERATEDLPRYLAALQRRGLKMPLVTTSITARTTPHAETVLIAAKKAGAQFYRFGFIEKKADVSTKEQLDAIKADLKELADLNKRVGIVGMLQNHSPSGHSYVGGDLSDLYELVKDFDPAQIGVAFDIGHALVVHGDGWREHFERLKTHLKVAYAKDVKREGRWVPFGQGELGQTGYFKLLRKMNYRASISLHIEFDWSDKGKNRTREVLAQALRQSLSELRKWLEG
jgi:sugar phosphate isomerase/epimerase